MVISRDQNVRRNHNIKDEIDPLKWWNNLDIWEQTKQIKILFRK